MQTKLICLSLFTKLSFWRSKQHILINVWSCNITLIKRVQVFQADVSKYLRITHIFWKALSPSGWDVYLLQKSFWTNENKVHPLSMFPLSNSSSAKSIWYKIELKWYLKVLSFCDTLSFRARKLCYLSNFRTNKIQTRCCHRKNDESE